MKPTSETDDSIPIPPTVVRPEKSSGWLGKLLALICVVAVAIAGFGSSSGWFDRKPSQDNSSQSELTSVPSLESKGGQASIPPVSSDVPSGTIPAQPATAAATPPLDAAMPSDSVKLLAEGKRVAEHLVQTLPTSLEAKEMQARFEYEFGETATAEKVWKEIVAINTNYIYALKGLGDVANLNGKLEEAVGYYRRAVLASPDDLTMQVLLGVSLLNASQFEEAKRTLESVLARDPSRMDAHVELASVLSQLQDFEGVREHLEIALKEHPELPEIHFGLVNAYSRLGNQEKAKFHQAEHLRLRKGAVAEREKGRRTYDDLSALNSDISGLYVLMARTYLAGGQREAAGLLLLRASKMNKADPECRRALAFLALNQGKPFDSIRWLTEVQEITPDDFEVAKEIVRLHVQNRQTKAAEKILSDFSSSHPEHVESARELARFYIQVDRNEEKAVQYGKAVTEVAPTAENMAMLASVYDAFDRLQDAIDAMGKAVELAPTNASYQQGLALLREALLKKKTTPETKP